MPCIAGARTGLVCAAGGWIGDATIAVTPLSGTVASQANRDGLTGITAGGNPSESEPDCKQHGSLESPTKTGDP